MTRTAHLITVVKIIDRLIQTLLESWIDAKPEN